MIVYLETKFLNYTDHNFLYIYTLLFKFAPFARKVSQVAVDKY